MSQIANTFYNLRILDEMARKKSLIHDIHPAIKVIVTAVFLVAVVSFERHEIIRLIPFLLYPVLIIVLSDLDFLPIFKRILLIEPLILGIGILNPIFEPVTGWMTFASIIIKSNLTVTAALLLFATTGMENLGYALRVFKIPKVFVLQLQLTYRYISVLLEEFSITTRAYSLRAPGHKGIKISSWGPLIGQILLRTFDRATRVYQAMSLRGFEGEYNTGLAKRVSVKDFVYLFCWVGFIVIAVIFNIPLMLGNIFMGVRF